VTAEEEAKILAVAEAMSGRAYAPYSGIRVGAGVLTAAGSVYGGCNVENASYSLTLCAERNAIAAAVAGEEGERLSIRAVAIWSPDLDACPPCGACRQVLAEFGPEALVLFRSGDGVVARTVSELLPFPFRLR
jgi:cytidine deaminase